LRVFVPLALRSFAELFLSFVVRFSRHEFSSQSEMTSAVMLILVMPRAELREAKFLPGVDDAASKRMVCVFRESV
jgi:hypothetical protein